MKKVYNKKGTLVAVSLSIKEQEDLACKNNLLIEQQHKLEDLDKWLEEQKSSTTESSSCPSSRHESQSS